MRYCLVACMLLWLGVLAPGCDFFGSETGDPGVEGVPPERLVAMVAVYKGDEGENAPKRLVVADFEDPSRYDVIPEAGNNVGSTCFSPGKRRILFTDHSGSTVDTRAPLKLYDLDTGESRTLGQAPSAATHGGTSMRCVWNNAGNGFYYQAAGAAGATYPVYFDLDTGESQPFGLETDEEEIYPTRFHGLEEGAKLLVSPAGATYTPEESGSYFYFLDTQTGQKIKRIDNEYLQFVAWNDESRPGSKKGAYSVTYDDASNRVAFMRKVGDERSLAVTDLEGSYIRILTKGAPLYMDLAWGPGETVIFSRGGLTQEPARDIYVGDVETGEVRSLIEPNLIGGATRVIEPDF